MKKRHNQMKIIEKVKQKGVILDGGMGSMLISRGLKGGDCAEKWNIDHPEVIQEIHRAYFDAGADVASANTFGASSFKLEKMGIKTGIETINTQAVKNAKAAADAFAHGQHDSRTGQGHLCPPGRDYRGGRCGSVSYRNHI